MALSVANAQVGLVDHDSSWQQSRSKFPLHFFNHCLLFWLVAGDELKLQEEESKVLDEIETIVRDRVAQNVPGQRKSRSRKAVVLDGTATNNQVASALGERKKPSAQQLSKKKKIEGEKKLASQAHRDAQVCLLYCEKHIAYCRKVHNSKQHLILYNFTGYLG